MVQPQPVHQAQVSDSGEFLDVVGHQHRIVGAGGGGKQQVVGTDGTYLNGKVGTYLSCLFGTAVVKG